MGRVCDTHTQFVPDGEDCPYCEPKESPGYRIDARAYDMWKSGPPAEFPPKATLMDAMNELLVKLLAIQRKAIDNAVWMPTDHTE